MVYLHCWQCTATIKLMDSLRRGGNGQDGLNTCLTCCYAKNVFCLACPQNMSQICSVILWHLAAYLSGIVNIYLFLCSESLPVNIVKLCWRYMLLLSNGASGSCSCKWKLLVVRCCWWRRFKYVIQVSRWQRYSPTIAYMHYLIAKHQSEGFLQR